MDKINIAELLKDCPKGMELDCTIWDNVTFECVDDREEFSIIIRLSDGCREAVTDYGCYSDNDGAKCVIYPKGKTTWEGFQRPFKDGDILTTNIGSIFIFSHLELDRIDDRNICKAYVGIRNTMPISLFHTEETDIFGPYESFCKFATEEEKEKLFLAIKDNGYKWNSETKTLEMLTQPKFKDGDIIAFDAEKGAQLFIFKEYIYNYDYAKCYMMLDCTGEIDFDSGDYYVERLATEEEKEKLFQAIKDNGYKWDSENKIFEELTELTESSEDVDDRLVMSGIYFDRENYADEVELHLNKYEIEIRDGKTYAVFKNQETKTDKLIEPIFKVGDRIKRIKTGNIYEIIKIIPNYYITRYFGSDIMISFNDHDEYELVSNKFDINSLVPFESRVLIRDTVKEKWHPGIWGFYDDNSYNSYPYKLIGDISLYCIPYEGNEQLLGTTDDCDEYFKTWK